MLCFTFNSLTVSDMPDFCFHYSAVSFNTIKKSFVNWESTLYQDALSPFRNKSHDYDYYIDLICILFINTEKT